MIAKILAKGAAADIVGYVMREFHDKEQFTDDTWRVIDSDGILGSDYRRIVDSFDIGASLNKRISKPIGHIAVSFDKADLPRLTDDFMVQLAKEYMERMGIRDTQYLIVRHLETGSPHFHIVYNRVNLHGKAIDESNNFDKSRVATKAIKLKYGLTFSPKKKLYEDAIAEMKPKIQTAMYRCKSWGEFRRRLAPAGISVEFYNDRDTGKPQGIRFSDGEFTFNGSKIDRAFSYKRLDKFFAKNAGFKEAQPQRQQPVSVTAKVKEAPAANVVENMIETGCQAVGGLFQVGPGYDPEEEAFIRAMKKKPKKKRKITVMADLYSLVKKQDEKIDDLLKTAKENKDLLTGIDTRLVSEPVQTEPSASAIPEKIQVELPANIATNESVKRLVEAALAKQKIEALKSLDFSQFPKELAEAFAKAFKDGLDKNVKNALHDGIRNEFTNQINGLNESAKKLTDRMYNIVNGAIWSAIPKWAYAVAGALLLIAVGLGIWCYNLNKENEHLQKVEWLYRYERVSYDAEGIRNMMLREEAMMVGNRQEQDSIKEMTIRLERRKNADRTHVYFRPSDP